MGGWVVVPVVLVHDLDGVVGFDVVLVVGLEVELVVDVLAPARGPRCTRVLAGVPPRKTQLEGWRLLHELAKPRRENVPKQRTATSPVTGKNPTCAHA